VLTGDLVAFRGYWDGFCARR